MHWIRVSKNDKDSPSLLHLFNSRSSPQISWFFGCFQQHYGKPQSCIQVRFMIIEVGYYITGMDCADCARNLQEGVKKISGVEFCQVDFTTTKMIARGQEGSLKSDQIEKLIQQFGYGIVDESQRRVKKSTRKLIWDIINQPRNINALVGLFLIITAMIGGLLGLPEPAKIVLLAAGGLIGVYYPAKTGWMTLKNGQGLDINILMTLAAFGAFLIGEYSEAATVIVLFSLGEALEGYTMERARDSIRGLMELAPTRAAVLRRCYDCQEHIGQPYPESTEIYLGGPCPWCGEHDVLVPIETLAVGDRVLVRTGDRIPMDGVVESGYSAVDQSPITGESIPVEKSEGMEVFAGSINGTGALVVEVTRLASDNTLARLIHLVEEAQTQQTSTQRFVDRFSKIYTPVVVIGAALLAIVPPLLFGAPFLDTPETRGWLYRALTLLVVACPCALVIATPVAVVSAISSLARTGVLVKGGLYLEKLGSISAVAFDKTGTLTQGRPELSEIACVDDCCRTARQDDPEFACEHCYEMLALAAAVEAQSSHPLSGAVIRAADRAELPKKMATNVKELPGFGVQGIVGGNQITIGSHNFFHQENGGFKLADYKMYLRKTETPVRREDFCNRVETAEAAGQTVMIVGKEDELLGYLAVSDPIRHDSKPTLIALKEAGVKHLVMLTGDNLEVARSIGSGIGLDDIQAGLLPEDKLAAVKNLEEKYGMVAMIGDGINDAPALAAASLGIAMGGAGTVQALETAGVALMADDLSQLPKAIQMSYRTERIIRINIWFALLAKVVFLIAAMGGIATLWMAVIADTGASLAVTLNGMRLLIRHQD